MRHKEQEEEEKDETFLAAFRFMREKFFYSRRSHSTYAAKVYEDFWTCAVFNWYVYHNRIVALFHIEHLLKDVLKNILSPNFNN